MEITIENYTDHCLKTWDGENQKERAELGIIGELGEVAEVLKKFKRKDFGTIERNKRLLKEFGDLLYYFAIDCWLHDINFVESIKQSARGRKHDLSYLLRAVNNHIQGNYELDFMESFISVTFHYGFNIEHIMQANIKKLSKRAENGLIQGDGSNRGE